MALYPLLRPLAFALDAERAHRGTIRALKLLPAGRPAAPDPALAVSLAGLAFPNPVGLAAGFDKDAEVFRQMLGLGFGFVEIGTLTPRPQAGNDRPRLFRLAEDKGVINRMGFNNKGQAAALARLGRRRAGLVGVNIGANKDKASGQAAIADYVAGVETMAGVADYLTINISSPNTPGLRALQGRRALAALLDAVMAARGDGRPVFLKVAPDLDPNEIDDVARAALDAKVDARSSATPSQSPQPQIAHRANRRPLRHAQGCAGAVRDFERRPAATSRYRRRRDRDAPTPRPNPRRRDPRPALLGFVYPAPDGEEINAELKPSAPRRFRDSIESRDRRLVSCSPAKAGAQDRRVASMSALP